MDTSAKGGRFTSKDLSPYGLYRWLAYSIHGSEWAPSDVYDAAGYWRALQYSALAMLSHRWTPDLVVTALVQFRSYELSLTPRAFDLLSDEEFGEWIREAMRSYVLGQWSDAGFFAALYDLVGYIEVLIDEQARKN